MGITITALGTAIPAYSLGQMETAKLLADSLHLSQDDRELLMSIYHGTEIEYRHSVLRDYHRTIGNFEFFPNDFSADFPSTKARMQIYKENAPKLAMDAIKRCLEKVPDIHPQDITHLIVVSCTGMYAPGLDIDIVQLLGLKTTTKRTCINFMGCYGTFNAIKVADAFCKADPSAKVLIVSVEICTIHLKKQLTMDNIVSGALFSDGAGAALVQAEKQHLQTSLSIDHFHCDIIPETSKHMAWEIADQGFDIVLSSYVPKMIREGINEFSKALLKQYGASLKIVDKFAIHPGGVQILHACEDSLQITPEHNKYSYDVMHRNGNMSSATILFVLETLWKDLTPEDNGKKIFSCAFGPGLTVESMLLTIHYEG